MIRNNINNGKITESVAKLCQVVDGSPTVQQMISSAPIIVREVQGWARERQALAADIQRVIVNREYDLKQFDRVADDMLGSMRAILNQIFLLQEKVTSIAHLAAEDPKVKTEIDYISNEINKSIQMFNNLTFHLLNA